MRPSLSIVIPSHNRSDLLRACLGSVTRHMPAGTEILVMDDASPAGAASAVAADFVGVRALRLPRRRGFCIAANAGIQAATGSIVELLNDDTEVLAGWAEAALVRFSSPAVAAVAPLVLSWPGKVSEVDSAGDRYYRGGIAGKRGHRKPLTPALLQSGPVFGASASSAFLRRSAFLRVGGFPESFGAYFEDVDLAFRLHRAGYQVLFEPGSRVLHHGSSSYQVPSRRLLEQQSRNEERVFWRNLPTPDLVRALPQHGAVLAAKAWRRWQEGGLGPFLWGRMRLLGEMFAVRRHRRWLRTLGPNATLSAWQIDQRFWHE